jgi:hypothetical protein
MSGVQKNNRKRDLKVGKWVLIGIILKKEKLMKMGFYNFELLKSSLTSENG